MDAARESIDTNISGLKLFEHQIAGHSPLFQYDSDTIAKALQPREYYFYRNIPELLKPHAPQYKGKFVVLSNDFLLKCIKELYKMYANIMASIFRKNIFFY